MTKKQKEVKKKPEIKLEFQLESVDQLGDTKIITFKALHKEDGKVVDVTHHSFEVGKDLDEQDFEKLTQLIKP